MTEKKLNTIPIKGKPYVMVNERVKAFRELYPDYALTTEILSLSGARVIMKASVTTKDGQTVATGHAYEDEGSNKINATSFIEVCETSAIGRALGCLGIGIDESYCTGDELLSALQAQEQKPITEDGKLPTAKDFSDTLEGAIARKSKLMLICDLLDRAKIPRQTFIRTMKVKDIHDLTLEQMDDAIKRLEAKLESASDK